MTCDPIAQAEPGERRRWFRFSLRTLLLLATALCVWLGFTVSRARQQERAVKAIEAAGGQVGYDYQYELATHTMRDKPQPTGPAWLRKLIGPHYFDTAISVWISPSNEERWRKTPSKRFTAIGPHLADLRRLKELTLSGLAMDDEEFAIVGELKALEKLSIGRMDVSDEAARQISAAKNLRELMFNETVISAKGVAAFKKLPRLEKFWLVCVHYDSGPHGEPIPTDKYKLGDDVVDAVVEFRGLRLLELAFTRITDAGVEKLSHLDRLEGFDISSLRVTDASMRDILRLKNLRSLRIAGTKIGDESLDKLQELPNLTELHLSATVTNDGLKKIARLSQLESLNLGGNQIDDRGLVYLEGMKNLKYLDVRGTNITTDGPAIKHFQRALPNCHVHQDYPPTGNLW